MKYYMISLDENPKDKLQYLSEFGIYPEVVKGVNGKTVSNNDVKEAVCGYYSEFGPKGAIGCAMSHMNIYKKIAEGENEYAVIMEDDVIFRNKEVEKTVMSTIDEAPEDFDIIYLGCFESDFFKNVMGVMGMTVEEKKVTDSLKKPSIALGTHAYIVSQKGAKKLLKELYGKVHNHIDYCIQYLYKTGKLNNYVITPRIAFQTSTDTGVSSMISSTTSHPKLISKYLSNVYVDDMVKASYVATLSVGRLGNITVTVTSLVIFVIGIVCALRKVNINTLSAIFWVLSIPDLIEPLAIKQVMFHYMLLILPSMIHVEK
jgi:GR25 family glycosyltransferase involved in LPS biosynthesis